jgi:hypothetical protein
MIQWPVRPVRLRVSVAETVGWPRPAGIEKAAREAARGAGPIGQDPIGQDPAWEDPAWEGAAPMLQRLAAAPRPTAPPVRSKIAATPEASAASTSRRLAVRSRLLGSPQGSTSTTASALHRNASSAARSTQVPSAPATIVSRAGSSPKPASPGP